MKIDAPWRCDKCNRLKEPTNGWLIGFMTEKDELNNGVFSVSAWDDKIAEQPSAMHLCGVECGQKWTTEQMGKLVNRN